MCLVTLVASSRPFSHLGILSRRVSGRESSFHCTETAPQRLLTTWDAGEMPYRAPPESSLVNVDSADQRPPLALVSISSLSRRCLAPYFPAELTLSPDRPQHSRIFFRSLSRCRTFSALSSIRRTHRTQHSHLSEVNN